MHSPGAPCAPGGSARQEAGDPPPVGRAVWFLNAVGREAPCGPSGRLRVRLRARWVGVRGRENLTHIADDTCKIAEKQVRVGKGLFSRAAGCAGS